MQLDRRETILLIVLSIAVLFLAVDFVIHDKLAYAIAHPPSPEEQYQEVDQITGGIIYRTWWSSEAFWGAVMSALTVVGFVLLIDQLRQTRKATTLTKRSIDAFIEAERGRILVHGVRAEPNANAVEDLHFVVENVGRGLLLITGEWINVTYLPIGVTAIPTIEPPFEFPVMLQPLTGGGRINTTNTRGLGVETRIPFTMPPMPPGTDNTIIRMVFRYETSFGEVRLAGFTWSANASTGRIIRVPTASNAFDVPIDFDFSTRP